MTDETGPARQSQTRHPLYHLLAARILEFVRQPDAVFWSYFFPVIMVIALGLAFNRKQEPPVVVDVVAPEVAATIRKQLASQPRIQIHESTAEQATIRLRTARTDLVVHTVPGRDGYVYQFDSLRPESAAARFLLDDALQRLAGRQDAIEVTDQLVSDPGSRYVDFLVPGMLGMNIMAGGLWGVGFAIVQMRIRKVLKRLVATPMKRSYFFWAVLGSRLLFSIPSVLIIFGFSWLAFGVVIRGNPLAVLVIIFLGALAFSGIGLLVASRANSVEMVSGLMNLVMLPMWLFSGVFFSTERFPDAMQPIIQLLPLTPLIAALRAITLEGAGLWEPAQLVRIGILTAWSVVTFALALKWFRWT